MWRMSKILSQLQPQKVFQYFEEISEIPRGSGNEQAISDYLVTFAKGRNLEVIQDQALNVIIKKPATAGYEHIPAVIIQGHMDMVCEKNQDTQHNFEIDPLKLKIDGDFIKATDTTLGADNGIAVAFALALLDSEELSHPALEVLITSDEEAGMTGAQALDPKYFTAKYLINIDSEEEGELYVSCAGGVRGDFSVPITWEPAHKDHKICIVKIRGLQGGHSGMEIDKGRGNANKLLARALHDMRSTIDFQLIQINGGAKSNAIPREMDAVISLDAVGVEKLKPKIIEWNSILRKELEVSDPEVRLELDIAGGEVEQVFSKETTKKVLQALLVHPNGIQTMSMGLPGLVESSLNIGVVTTKENEVLLESAIRSSIGSLKEAMVRQLYTLAENLGASFKTHDDYPSWSYDPNSKLRGLFAKVYQDLYGKEPAIKSIHAGLECGLFSEKFEDVDMISFGPNIYGAHTPEERMSISSVQNTWEYFTAVLKEMKNL